MRTATPPDLLEQRLTGFLSGAGLAIDDLRSEVEETLGESCAVLASGSVLQGFGNERSDVDLCVIVDRENIAQLPMMSYKEKARIDATYYSARDVLGWIDCLRDTPWPPAGPVADKDWRAQRRRLHALRRFASGLVLSARDDWAGRLAELHSGWLAERIWEWRWVDALRLRVAARWLEEANPMQAAQCWCDAVLAGLEVRATRAGEMFAMPKWLPEKLTRLGDAAGLAILRQAIRSPLRAADVDPYRKQCEEQLRALASDLEPPAWLAEPRLRLELHYARGITVAHTMGGSLVTRWGMRGVELPAIELPMPTDGAPVWRGPVDEAPPAPIRTLFTEDMLWLSVSSATPR